ncbi:MAG: response regulator transcription factor [Acidimicrobiia bacterium]|jgi:two-component system response regulator MprA|nr:response regulator transcription factor [Acidimicrobiia bacterium]MBJ7381093.1 response regulator transcription factor [Acidimicrobiia bacterium]MBJ7512871.1 response regulator transcription factor [Acidimicrobiia bacterium]
MKILLVDDDPGIRLSVQRSLEFEGYRVTTAEDGEAALIAIAAAQYDCVILDISMPRLDGLGVCRRLRQDGNDIPVLVLTARQQVADRVSGLDAGADDYLAKPFALEELLARVRALLRRRPVGEVPGEVLRVGDLEMDLDSHRATRSGVPIDLTRTEWTLLEELVRNSGIVLSRDLLSDRIWGQDFGTAASLDVYIGYIRRKTEADGATRLIQTVRGIGFVARVEK